MLNSFSKRLDALFNRARRGSISPEEFEAIVENAENVKEVHRALSRLPEVYHEIELAWLARHGLHWDESLLKMCFKAGPERLCTLAHNPNVNGAAAEWVVNALLAPINVENGEVYAGPGKSNLYFELYPDFAGNALMFLAERAQIAGEHPALVAMWNKVRMRSITAFSLPLVKEILKLATVPLADVRKIVDEREGNVRLLALKHLLLRGGKSEVAEYSGTLALAAPESFASMLPEMSVERRAWIPQGSWMLLLNSTNAAVRLSAMRFFVPGGDIFTAKGEEERVVVEGRTFSDAGERVPYFIREQEARLKGRKGR